MAIRPAGGTPEAPHEPEKRDEPDKPAKPGAPSGRSSRNVNRTAQRPQPKLGQHEEEHEQLHEQQAQLNKTPEVPAGLKAEQQKAVASQALKQQGRDEQDKAGGRGGGGAGGGGGGPSRAEQARSKGFQTTPGLGDFVRGQASPKAGAKFAEVVPSSRVPLAPLPEPELRPPIFLSTFEGMKDIYLRVKGRASPKTRELLEGPHLEDLVKMVVAIAEDEKKSRAPEARVAGPVYAKLKADPGPLLTGLNDPRLKEPWRLFLDGWEVWVPDDKKKVGIELFLEGEGEDDHGEPMEILQVLRLVGNELTLETKLGTLRDRVSYDGERYYRLKSDAAS